MKLSVGGSIACIVLVGLQVGCAGHSVKYTSFLELKIARSERAVSILGSFDEAKERFEQAQLPHNTPRQRFELILEGLDKLTDQLGSPDYVVIGEVFGGGNAWANQETLRQELCRKAARNGGDVVMIFKRSTVEQPYSYATPGYSTTNASASAYGNGNSATAYGTSHTTYTPSQTYSGVVYKPQANGLVFKYVQGIGAERRLLQQADDESLSSALTTMQQLGNDKNVSWEDYLARWREIVQSATSQASSE